VAITASQLRQDVYRLLDQVLATGRPLEIERNGQLLRIAPATGTSRLSRVATRPDLINGDPDDLVHLDWSDAWRP
jgi:hypothetical protein